MLRSENDLNACVRAFSCVKVFQNKAYIPQLFTRSSHPENLSVLMGWRSGIAMDPQNEAYIYIYIKVS